MNSPNMVGIHQTSFKRLNITTNPKRSGAAVFFACGLQTSPALATHCLFMSGLLHALPAINASLNGLATLLLIAGFVLIKKDGRAAKNAHRACMLSAFGVSVLFLACYLLHKTLKAQAGEAVNTAFAGEGLWRWIYYPMLISHVVLAMVIVPLIFVTLHHAFKGRFDQHQAWARWTFPLWFYVSITGVLVYFFLYQWFPATA